MSTETVPGVIATANVEPAGLLFGVTSMEVLVRDYVDGLGSETTNHWVVDGKVRWCWLRHGGAALMLQEYSKDCIPSGKPTKV